MVQGEDGYLWFGTFAGLVRFDGVKFTRFDTTNTPALPDDGIVNLHLDRTERLWVSTYRGLVVREGTRWRQFGPQDGWSGDFVRTFAERSEGGLLLTTFDGKVLEYSDGRLHELPLPPGTKGPSYFGHAVAGTFALPDDPTAAAIVGGWVGGGATRARGDGVAGHAWAEELLVRSDDRTVMAFPALSTDGDVARGAGAREQRGPALRPGRGARGGGDRVPGGELPRAHGPRARAA